MQPGMSAAEQLELMGPIGNPGGSSWHPRRQWKLPLIVGGTLLALAAAAVTIIVVLLGSSADESDTATAWDKGKHHPAAALLNRGSGEHTATPSVVKAADWWDRCTLDECYDVRLGVRPTVVPIGVMHLKQRCLTLRSAASRPHALVATNRTGNYRASLDTNGNLTLCAGTAPAHDDIIVAWES